MWVLQLNPMTDRFERVDPVAVADTPQALEQFLVDQTAPEPYQDGNYYKVFRKGSVLEWYNPPLGGHVGFNVPAIFDIGTAEDWADRARKEFDAITSQLYRL
jgi:hypothetical protein